MKSYFKASKLAFAGLAALALIAGCAQTNIKVNGGGTMPSTSGIAGDKAVFTFHAQKCAEDDAISGRTNFHDMNSPGWKDGGVKFTGAVVQAGQCGYPGSEVVCSSLIGITATAVYAAEIGYKSTNPKYPGSGIAIIAVADSGQGINSTASDDAIISVTSGPYLGYQHLGGGIQGNINSKSCQ